jgi:hypothetical protein
MNHISLIGISEIEPFQIYEHVVYLITIVDNLVVFDYRYLLDMNHLLYRVNKLTKLNWHVDEAFKQKRKEGKIDEKKKILSKNQTSSRSDNFLNFSHAIQNCIFS